MIDQTLRETETKMGKAVEHTQEEFAAIRTGRAHPAMFSQITADYYGTPTPLQQLAGFQVPEPRTVIISPYDMGAKSAIEKAIRESDLGVNPSDDGKVLRVTLPELTEERRKELSRHVAHEGENAKVAVRNVRRDALHQAKELLKEKKISEDDERRAEEEIQKFTDRFVKDIDGVVKAKEDELMAV